MARHFFPQRDDDLRGWAENFYNQAAAFYANQGWDDGPVGAVKLAALEFAQRLADLEAARAAFHAAAREKDESRATLVALVRDVVRVVQAAPVTTNADRAAMGIAVKADAARSAVPPRSAPVVLVDYGTRLTHALRLVDADAPTRRARPRGVQRAEVFCTLTPAGEPPPASLDAYRYAGSVGDGAISLSFSPPQGGHTAHYLARWATARGALGPWSEVASATVAA